MTLQEQAAGLLARSMEVLRHKFDKHPDSIPDQLALQMFGASTRALGYGARPSEHRVEVNVTTQIESHADDLVRLLRREKAKVIDQEPDNARPSTHPQLEAPLASDRGPLGGAQDAQGQAVEPREASQ